MILGNGFKRKIEEKRKEVEIFGKAIHVLEEKRKKLRSTIVFIAAYFIFICSY